MEGACKAWSYTDFNNAIWRAVRKKNVNYLRLNFACSNS